MWLYRNWAAQADCPAVVAKATPPHREVMTFMGGQPARAYRERGFEIVASWVDPELRSVVADRRLVPEGADLDAAATISCCVRRTGSL